MLIIEGIYDSQGIKALKEIPFKTEKKLIITFLDDAVCETDSKDDSDPIKALRGCSKNFNLTEKLLKSRREDLQAEVCCFS